MVYQSLILIIHSIYILWLLQEEERDYICLFLVDVGILIRGGGTACVL